MTMACGLRYIYGLIILVLAVSGCSLNANIQTLPGAAIEGGGAVNTPPSNSIQRKIYLQTTSVTLSEGSFGVFNILSDSAAESDIEVTLQLTGSAGRFQSLPTSLIIPKGSTSVSFVLQTVDDLVYQGNEDFVLKISSLVANLKIDPDTMNIHLTDNEMPIVNFALATSTLAEPGGNVNVQITLSALSSYPVSIPWTVTGTATAGASNDYVINTASPLVIPAGQLTGNISITVNDDSINEPSETIILTLGVPTNGSLGMNTIHTLTIGDDDLGNFAIAGIQGASDTTSDAFLVSGINPNVYWGSSVGATNYDVTIYANDGTTVTCATQNTTSTNYNFSSCNLTLGGTYKARVVAKAPGLTMEASNNLFSFYVNRPPVANADGPIRVMKNSSATVLHVVTAVDSVARGTVADSDPDAGDTLTITAVSQGDGGGAVTFTSSSVSYTPVNGFTGVEDFTYTLSDNHGATATGNVRMHVMDSYTWTGKVSSSWNANGNWCGTISNNACQGSTGYPNSTANSAMVAVFDGTCSVTGHTCGPTINAAVSTYGIRLNTGFSGTLTQSTGAGNTLAVGVGGHTQVAGIFMGGNATIQHSGAVTVSGGAFVSTSSALTSISDWSFTGSSMFSANNGTIVFGNGMSGINHNLRTGTGSYNNVTLTGWGSTYALNNGTWNIDGVFTLNDSNSGNVNAGTINAYGNVNATNRGITGSAVLVLAGGMSGQTLAGTVLGAGVPNVRIEAGVNPVTISGYIITMGNWTYVSSGTLTTAGSTIKFGNGSSSVSHVITPGNVNYDNITFDGWSGSYSLGGGTLNVLGTLTLSDSNGGATLNSGTINAYGNVTSIQKGVSGGSGKLVIAGNGSGQTIEGSNSGIPDTQIVAGTNPVTLVGTLHTMKNWEYISSGTFTATGSTILFGNGASSSTHSFIPGPVLYDSVGLFGYGSSFSLSTSDLVLSGTLSLTDGYINGGRFYMNGRNVTAGAVTISSGRIVKGGGTLTVNGSIVGTGAMFGGFVDP